MREKQERSEFGDRNNGGSVDLSLLMASIPAISSSGLAIVNCLASFEGGGGGGDEGGGRSLWEGRESFWREARA